MVFWLVAGIIVYLITAYVPAIYLLANVGIDQYFGSRDNEQTTSLARGRALRAARNFSENFPVFALLGILAIVVEGADMDMAIGGAGAFILSRVVYLLLYMLGVPVVRSLAFLVGWIGMILMAWALF